MDDGGQLLWLPVDKMDGRVALWLPIGRMGRGRVASLASQWQNGLGEGSFFGYP